MVVALNDTHLLVFGGALSAILLSIYIRNISFPIRMCIKLNGQNRIISTVYYAYIYKLHSKYTSECVRIPNVKPERGTFQLDLWLQTMPTLKVGLLPLAV